MESTGLLGMKAISDYYGKSEPTILKLIREENFPAAKIGGEWESDKKLVDSWRRKRIVSSLG